MSEPSALDFWQVLYGPKEDRVAQVEMPSDLTGWKFMLSGGGGVFALGWKKGNVTRVRSKASHYPRIEQAIEKLPEGIIYWFGVYEDGIMIMDILSEAELTGEEESPVFSERQERVQEIHEALDNIDKEYFYPTKLYERKEDLKWSADQYGLRIIGVKDVPFSQRAFCVVYEGDKDGK